MKPSVGALLAKIEFPLLLAGLIIAGGLWGFEELME
ncbi:MAG: phosphoesterase, partial [Mesorhizobium sp.]